MDVDIDLIKPSPYQPRLFFEVDDLKEEIQRDGLLSALVVRKKDEYYELLDGERRLRTLKELGWKIVPIDVRKVDDKIARRSVYKLNKIRENYTIRDEATYFKKLFDEGMKPYQIETELGADHHWVQACLNIWEFPEDIRNNVFGLGHDPTPYRLYMSDIRSLEDAINRSPEEAVAIARQIIAERMTADEKRALISRQQKKIDEALLKRAETALGEPEAKPLETPEDLERAAKALQEEAKRRAETMLTPEQKVALEAEQKAKAEAQAAAKAQRDEEQRQQKAEQEQRRQGRAEAKVRAELKGDKTFIHDALKALPREDRLEILDMAPVPEKSNQPKGLSEQFQELMKEASQLVNKTERLMSDPGFQELDLGPLGLELHLLTDAFTELSAQIGGNDGEKKRPC